MPCATLDSPNRQALRFLGIAIAVSVVLSFPIEQVTHTTQAPGRYWFQNSCGSVEFLLNLGLIIQAILTPLFVFLLPGPGSIFPGKVPSSSLASVRPSSPTVDRALARPEDHASARSRGIASSVEARSLLMVVAVVIGIIGLLMFLRSGWQLKHIEFFAGKSSSTSVTWLRSAALSETVIELIVGLAGVGAAIFLLCLYMPSQPALYMLVGWLSAAAVPFAWWYGVRGYAELHGECAALFDSSLPVHVFQPDFLADCAHYFKFLSGFSAVWVGVTAGGLRLQSARAAEGNSSGNEFASVPEFLLDLSDRLGGAISSGPVVDGGFDLREPGMGHVLRGELCLYYCQFLVVAGLHPFLLEPATADAVAVRGRSVLRDLRDLPVDRPHVFLAHDVGWAGPGAAGRAESIGRGMGFDGGHVAVACIAEARSDRRGGGWNSAAGKTARSSRFAGDRNRWHCHRRFYAGGSRLGLRGFWLPDL